MGLINDLIDRFRYGDSDYDDYEEDYEDEYVEETNTNSRRASTGSNRENETFYQSKSARTRRKQWYETCSHKA